VKYIAKTGIFSKFYILLTVNHVTIFGKWPTWRTILFYVFIYIFNSLHVSSTSFSSSGETNCVNTTAGSCHSVSVAVSCAGRKWKIHRKELCDTLVIYQESGIISVEWVDTMVKNVFFNDV